MGSFTASVVGMSLLVSAPPVGAGALPQLKIVEQVLDRMAQTYAKCETYRDAGYVRTDFISADGNDHSQTKAFATAFVRGEAFRFEYESDPDELGVGGDDKLVIHRRGVTVTTHWETGPAFNRVKSLADALATAAGVSSSTSRRIAPMLLPAELPAPRLSQIKDPKWIEDAKQDDVDCYRVEGKHSGSPVTLWIDKKTLLLRRIDSSHRFTTFRTETATVFFPTHNEKIPEEALRFDPEMPD